MKLWNLQVDHSHALVHSPEELAGLYRDSAAGGLIDASERDMLAGILNVDERLVREIMTPRPRLVTVPAAMSAGEALARLAEGTAHPVPGHRRRRRHCWRRPPAGPVRARPARPGQPGE